MPRRGRNRNLVPDRVSIGGAVLRGLGLRYHGRLGVLKGGAVDGSFWLRRLTRQFVFGMLVEEGQRAGHEGERWLYSHLSGLGNVDDIYLPRLTTNPF